MLAGRLVSAPGNQVVPRAQLPAIPAHLHRLPPQNGRRLQQHGPSRADFCRVQAGQTMIDALGGSTVTAPRAWWNDKKELWAEVDTEEQLDAELLGNGKELVVLGTAGFGNFRQGVTQSC